MVITALVQIWREWWRSLGSENFKKRAGTLKEDKLIQFYYLYVMGDKKGNKILYEGNWLPLKRMPILLYFQNLPFGQIVQWKM